MTDYLSLLSAEQRELVGRIGARVVGGVPEALWAQLFATLPLQLAATYQVVPLDLDELLGADEFTFWHDVVGIVRHLDLATGRLRLTSFVDTLHPTPFLPRCARSGEVLAFPLGIDRTH